MLLLLLFLQDDPAKLYADGKYAEAATAYEKAIERRPSPELWAALGRCKLQLRDGPGAEKAFEAALKPDSTADIHRGLGHARVLSGKFDAGVAALRKARTLEPEGGDTLWIARALARKGSYAAAELEAARVETDEGTELLAWIATRRGRHAEAAELYARLGPKHLFNYGQALAAAGREAEAIDVLEAARRLGRKEVLRSLADLYLRADMPREAADCYAALPSPDVEDWLRLGHARLRAGEKVSAREAFAKAVGRPEALVQLGLLSEPAEARRLFREAKAWAALGDLELKAGDAKAAAVAYAEALKTDRSAATHYAHALALRQSGQDALPAIREGLREHPLDERLRSLLK
jgi:tetratricopeptide (TPR) repeat protein